jgi:hypothetical protein
MLWGEAYGYDRPLIAIYKKKGYLPRVAFSHANAKYLATCKIEHDDKQIY